MSVNLNDAAPDAATSPSEELPASGPAPLASSLPPPLPPFSLPPPLPNPQPVDKDWEDFESFAGKNAGQFRGAWASTVGAFCWLGFFAPVIWFLYRKMYGIATAILFFPIGLALLFPAMHVSQYLGIVISCIGGIFGRRLYIVQARGIIAELRGFAEPDEDIRDQIAAAGGVSFGAGIIGSVLSTLLVAVMIANNLMGKPH